MLRAASQVHSTLTIDRRNAAHHVYTYHHLTDKQILSRPAKRAEL
jgi:hypothetical protein